MSNETKTFTPGQTVTIVPVGGPGMSRDTEPGLQPWDATFVRYTDEGNIVIDQGAPYGEREMTPDNVYAARAW